MGRDDAMEAMLRDLMHFADITSRGFSVDPDAEALVYRSPRVKAAVPGSQWTGSIGEARGVIRLPDRWNGKLIIGATGGVRSEYSLDLFLGDIALQRGYAFAASDKGTPHLTLRDAGRHMGEWKTCYEQLTTVANALVRDHYGKSPERVYIAGISNGGYVVRAMLEQSGRLFDGGVDCEGVLWHTGSRHLLTCLPVYLSAYPIFRNWWGDATASERSRSFWQLVEAGLDPRSSGAWEEYFRKYWVVSLWLYGRNLDPTWPAFAADWTDDWLRNPSDLASYPWRDRQSYSADGIAAIANSGVITAPLLSVAGNWDCLVPFPHHAEAYGRMVAAAGKGRLHRIYEIDRANHVDGLLRQNRGFQQPIQPFCEAALYHLENWVERAKEPPASGLYAAVGEFAGEFSLYTAPEEGEQE